MITDKNQFDETKILATSWKDLYRLGTISCYTVAALILFAIIAFFIWKYEPGLGNAKNALLILQKDRFGGLIALDLVMFVIVLTTIIPVLSLYISLKRINESFALIALVLGLMAIISVIPARPLSEWLTLSDKFAIATTEEVRNQYLAAGESLQLLFKGTSWMIYTVFSGVSSILFSILMMKSKVFTKTAAWIGIIISISGLCIFVPVIGIPLALISTLGSALWYVLMARSLFILGWSK